MIMLIYSTEVTPRTFDACQEQEAGNKAAGRWCLMCEEQTVVVAVKEPEVYLHVSPAPFPPSVPSFTYQM